MKNHFFWFVTVLITVVKQGKSTVAQNISKNTYAPLDPKIVGGKPETFEGNWHVASIRLISFDTPFGRGHWCAGSLFASHKIVTAAHCVFKKLEKDLKIVMGTLDRFKITNNTIIISNGITYACHPDYSRGDLKNDVAVIFLSKGVPADHPVVKPITLNRFVQETGTSCKVTGWGYRNYEQGRASMPRVLHGAEINVIDYNTCKKFYRYSWLDDGMMCATDRTGTKGPCPGDSGGGLVCNDTLVGIVSWGIVCGEPCFPGVYRKIASYFEWIQNCKTGVVPIQKQHESGKKGKSQSLEETVSTVAQKISKNTYAPLDPKIVGGKPETFKGNWHVASFRYIPADTPFGNGHFCAGSLFSSHKIVTAAHCLFKKPLLEKYLKIVMGTLDRYKITDNTIIISNGITYACHPYYNQGEHNDDVAVIFLSKGIPADHPVVKPITLNTINQETGTSCKITGWGYRNYEQGEASMPRVLHGVEINVLDIFRCEQVYAKLWYDGMMCAGDWTGAKDSCPGDSGGGLVCNDTLVGIVSWGIECGEPCFPGVYTKIASYFEWIKNCESGVVPIQKQHLHSYSIMFSLIVTAFL